MKKHFWQKKEKKQTRPTRVTPDEFERAIEELYSDDETDGALEEEWIPGEQDEEYDVESDPEEAEYDDTEYDEVDIDEYDYVEEQAPATGYAQKTDEPVLMDSSMRVTLGGADRHKIQVDTKKRKKIEKILTLMIFIIVWAGLLTAAYFVLKIKTIEVAGDVSFPKDEIAQISGIKVDSQIWLANIEKAKKNIQENPYIKVESIKRQYPDKILITVSQRKEVAAISYQNLSVIIDGEGYVLSIGARAQLDGLLLVTGMHSTGYSLNQKLGQDTDFYGNTLISIITALRDKNLLERIAELDMSNPLSIVMKTTDGVDVLLGQAEDLSVKLDHMAIVLPELMKLGYATSGTLDLSAKGDPVYSLPESHYAPTATNTSLASPTDLGGTPDGGTPDGGTPDGGTPDGGTPDGGTPDNAPDGGTPDDGTPDDTPDGG